MTQDECQFDLMTGSTHFRLASLDWAARSTYFCQQISREFICSLLQSLHRIQGGAHGILIRRQLHCFCAKQIGMIPWKQRLYAFLLRRILGPILDAASTQKLHESIEVSFQEGKFVLKDVTLNSCYLTQRLAAQLLDQKFSVKRAQIGKLEINLSLQEHTISELPQHRTAPSSSSLAWRAIQLGKTSASESRVSLVAHIEISCVNIEIESNTERQNEANEAPKTTSYAAVDATASNDDMKETSRASSSFISSYVESALSSLHLSLQVNDLLIHLVASADGANTSPKNDHILEIRLASAYYRDVPFTERIDSEGKKSQTMLNKVLDFAGITVFAGEKVDEIYDASARHASRLMIVQTEGTGQMCLRVVEYSTSDAKNGPSDTVAKIQQDIECKLNQRVNVWLDERSLSHVLVVSSALHFSPLKMESGLKKLNSKTKDQLALERIDENAALQQDADYFTMTGIVKQYQEAWLLAERHEVRGGILIPSHAFEDADVSEDDGGVVTFDAFFDANDQSFHSYASKLRESILCADGANEGDDFIHTKVRFFLREMGIKFVFPKEAEASKVLLAEEYVLSNFSDINFSGSLSRQSSNLSVSISHLEVDDSQLNFDQLSPIRVDIGNILQFKQVSVDCAWWQTKLLF
jgi:hypothetical protein